jgi:hypothetical protein
VERNGDECYTNAVSKKRNENTKLLVFKTLCIVFIYIYIELDFHLSDVGPSIPFFRVDNTSKEMIFVVNSKPLFKNCYSFGNFFSPSTMCIDKLTI